MNIHKKLSFHNILFVSVICVSSVSCANDNDDKAQSVSEEIATTTVAETVTKTASETETPMTHGEQVHNDHCQKCHTDDVYTRDNRFVKSIDALSKQVVRCKDGTGAPWFDEDTEAVVQFLNNKYYRF